MDLNKYYSSENYDPKSIKSISDYAKKLKGKSLSEVCHSDILSNTYGGKGNFGHYLEKFYFGYEPNNTPGPDFSYVGMELKSGAVKKKKDGTYAAKERLAIGKINFNKIVDENFEESSVWHKLWRPLLVFHFYEKDVDPRDYKVCFVDVIKMTNYDIAQIKQDWLTIKKKVLDGMAHHISSGDTLYLEAATTGSKNQKYIPQPNSKELAHPRRFALKPAFVTGLLNMKSGGVANNDYSEALEKTISPEKYLLTELSKMRNMPLIEVLDLLEMKESKQKNFLASVSKKLISKLMQDKFNYIPESSDFILKTCRTFNGKLKEHVSFPYIRYSEMVDQDWDTSDFRETIESKFLFVFWESKNDSFYLNKIKIWNLDYSDLQEARRVWELTKAKLLEQKPLELPKTTDSYLIHVRPHGRNSRDTYLTHYGEKVKKQSFWLNKKFIEETIV